MEINEQIIDPPKFMSGSIPLGIASVEDYEFCRQVMRNASRRYSFASNFLPADKLRHVEALYAFLRVGDDRVDISCEGFESPFMAIDDWENAYWRAFEIGDSPEPVIRAYLNTAFECGIPCETMKAYFRAMKEDLSIKRFPSFSDLMHYIEGSAVPVGRAMTHILGVRKPFTFEEAIPRADSLSIAMQLSNFLRDVGYDWNIGRIYLPLEDLALFNVSEKDFSDKRIDYRFIQLIEFEIERAEQFYTRAKTGIDMLATGRWGVMSALEIYHAILADIRRIGYDVFNKRADPRRLYTMWLVTKSWLSSI